MITGWAFDWAQRMGEIELATCALGYQSERGETGDGVREKSLQERNRSFLTWLSLFLPLFPLSLSLYSNWLLVVSPSPSPGASSSFPFFSWQEEEDCVWCVRDDGEAKKETLTDLSVKRRRKRNHHHHTRLHTHTSWCFEIMMAALGPTPATTRAYILDKYFLELEKYWEDEKNNSIRHQRSAGQSVLIINCLSSYLSHVSCEMHPTDALFSLSHCLCTLFSLSRPNDTKHLSHSLSLIRSFM